MYNKIFKPENLIECNNAVNVEIISENENRSIRILSLGAHQKISTHKTELIACVYLLEGEIQFVINKEIYELIKGEMLIIPANTEHSLFAKMCSKMLLIKI